MPSSHNGRITGLGGLGNKASGFKASGLKGGPLVVNYTNDSETFAFHPNGAQILFADGAVHMIQKTVDALAFKSMLTRAGGEVIPGGAF